VELIEIGLSSSPVETFSVFKKEDRNEKIFEKKETIRLSLGKQR